MLCPVCGAAKAYREKQVRLADGTSKRYNKCRNGHSWRSVITRSDGRYRRSLTEWVEQITGESPEERAAEQDLRAARIRDLIA